MTYVFRCLQRIMGKFDQESIKREKLKESQHGGMAQPRHASGRIHKDLKAENVMLDLPAAESPILRRVIACKIHVIFGSLYICLYQFLCANVMPPSEFH